MPGVLPPAVADEWELPGALAGERLDRAVALLSGASRGQVNGWLEAGHVSVGGQIVTSRSRRVRAGEVVALDAPIPAGAAAPAADPAVVVPVVWSDDQVIVVDKPAGVVVHPGAGNRAGTLVHGLLARFPDLAERAGGSELRPGIVHRLDKGTSGLLMVARTPEAHAALVAQLARRQVGREYETLVWGTVEADAGLVDAPLGRSTRDPTRFRVQAGGRPARTRYFVEARYGHPVPSTELRCQLETGRTHQIRVHLASIGHPVVGDDRYGPRVVEGWRPLASGRLFLHAGVLSFDHPVTGERLSFSSPLPEDLRRVLDAIVGALHTE
jgi:23S rRNA pseudouridine1911/1915/1917 synthase